MDAQGEKKISVIMTVRNDLAGTRLTMDSLLEQTRTPDAVIVVDGGSTDGTVQLIHNYQRSFPIIRLIQAPGVNIARGRNIAVDACDTELIATTDAGCKADPNWLARLLEPFEQELDVEFVAGFYHVDAQTLFEEVVGLATMRGQLDEVCSETFNPSARSMACSKDVWRRAGGWPEWIGFSEDTLFDHKVRSLGVEWRFAGDAIVSWRPRKSFKALAKQFFNYGTGRGHTQIDAPSFFYNMRNVALVACSMLLCLATKWAALAVVGLSFYFYVWTFSNKAFRIAGRTKRWSAYPLCFLIMWVVLFSNLAGFVRGSFQRWRHRDRYHDNIEAYLAVG